VLKSKTAARSHIYIMIQAVLSCFLARQALRDSGIQDGTVTVISRHTTTGVTINEHESR
jgi:thiamine phosphate synthase YjbQ (UPF0047 family)